ncbi:hypothetical protein MMC13_005333 [Lambiella insularis]|nr:hypothetical protein [Lambiella insularis]
MNETISACLAKAKPELGNDIVEYPAAFLEIVQAIGNRKLYLDSLSHLAWKLSLKYSAALKNRVEALIALMGEFIWPSIVMIRPELTVAELIAGMKAYRSYLSNELGRNGRGGGYTTLSGRDAQGGHKKLDYFTELPIKEHDDDEHDVGVLFAEFTADFEYLT